MSENTTTANEYAKMIYEELSLSGFALMPEQVNFAVNHGVRTYSTWASFEVEYNDQDPLNRPLTVEEWGILEPFVRAHCNLLQARLVDASRPMGIEGFIDINSAEANLKEEEAILIHKAYYEPPITFDFCEKD